MDEWERDLAEKKAEMEWQIEQTHKAWLALPKEDREGPPPEAYIPRRLTREEEQDRRIEDEERIARDDNTAQPWGI